MRLLTFAFVFMGFVSAFAQQRNFAAQPSIQVTVNGRTYNCSGDLSDMNCYRAGETAKSKFAACISAGYSGSSCFQNAFPTKFQNCSHWSDNCNTSCKAAGLSAGSCYQTCY